MDTPAKRCVATGRRFAMRLAYVGIECQNRLVTGIILLDLVSA